MPNHRKSRLQAFVARAAAHITGNKNGWHLSSAFATHKSEIP
jgi:hypothetical protein